MANLDSPHCPEKKQDIACVCSLYNDCDMSLKVKAVKIPQKRLGPIGLKGTEIRYRVVPVPNSRYRYRYRIGSIMNGTQPY